MIAGSNDPLFDDWDPSVCDPTDQWRHLFETIAARGKSLAEDSAECAAMVRAKLLRIHGPNGLKFRSLYQQDDSPTTTDAEVQTRRKIEKAIARGSCYIDAGGVLSRAQLDWQISWSACVLGDGFAVRTIQEIPGIPTFTRWRLVHPSRVCNPADKTNDPRFHNGIELDNNGRPVALWIDQNKLSPGGVWLPSKPVRFPWYGADGVRNVVHKPGFLIPGSLRGLSEFAPIMMPARMLQGVTIAYVANKRVQSSHPMLIHVDDLEKAKQAYRGTRISNLLVGRDHKIEFPNWKFEGADYREFVDAVIRSLCAAWQLPWELVMGDHSAKSGASSRSLWQQHYQMADREQAEHVDCVQRPMDESLVREADAVENLGLGDDWHANMAGMYQGPPKVMPDPAKEISWAEGMRALGVSRTTILNRFGEDFRDEVMQDRQDAELEKAQGIKQPEPKPAVIATPPPPSEPDAVDPSDSADPQGTTDAQAARKLLPRVRRAAAHEDEMTRDDFLAGMRAFGDSMRSQTAQPVINANITLPEKVIATMQMPQPIINVEGAVVNVPKQDAPVVNVAAPIVENTVNVEAADPAAPAPIQVNVAAPAVNIDNQVVVPARTVIAEPIGGGKVKMTPQ